MKQKIPHAWRLRRGLRRQFVSDTQQMTPEAYALMLSNTPNLSESDRRRLAQGPRPFD